MIRLALVLLLVAFLTSCGGDTDSSPKPVPTSSAQLRITVWPQGKAGPSSSTRILRCPAGPSTLPAARAACRRLSGLDASAFAPVPAGTACTEIYGGPQVALVSGRFAGERIHAVFNRSNGCEIERWERLAFLFPTTPWSTDV